MLGVKLTHVSKWGDGLCVQLSDENDLYIIEDIYVQSFTEHGDILIHFGSDTANIFPLQIYTTFKWQIIRDWKLHFIMK